MGTGIRRAALGASLSLAAVLLTLTAVAGRPPGSTGSPELHGFAKRAAIVSRTRAGSAAPLQAAWESAIRRAALSHAAISAYAFDLTTDRPLAAIHPDVRLTPASIVKLFTSAAALNRLGPSFRYTTRVAVSAQAGPNPGPIFLIGGGDPWLEADGSLTLEHLASEVAKKVRSATRVVGDGAFFSGPSAGTGWTWDDLPWNYAPNLSGLTSERDQLNILLSPRSPGLPPAVAVNPLNPSVDPPPGFLRIHNAALSVQAGRRDTASVFREPGTNDVWISGDLPQGATDNAFLSIHDPALLSAALFQTLLARDGVRFLSSPEAGTPAKGLPLRVIAAHESPPLSQYLQIQNTYSINLMAENLLRTLGTLDGGNGSAASGTAAVQSFLARAGLASGGTLVDGSGLSPLDETSAGQVVSLLRFAAGRPWFPVFEHSLIHAGRTNQCSFLCGRLDSGAANGNVWLKTGNLNNQWNYAGYARARNGNRIAFAILMDGLRSGSFFQQAIGPQDQMTQAVADWPHEPSSGGAALGAGTVSVPPPPGLLTLLPVPPQAGDLVAVSAASVATGRTVWRENEHARLEPGLLPRLAVLAAVSRHPAALSGDAAVYADGPVTAGVLRGPLILASSRDVELQPGDLAALAGAVRRAGIRSVAGAVEYVQPRVRGFSGARQPPSMPWEVFGRPYAPPVSALTVAGDRVTLAARGAASGAVSGVVVGKTPVTVDPSYAPILAYGAAAPSSAGRTDAVSALQPAGRTDAVAASWVRGSDAFRVSGSVSPGGLAAVQVSAPQPGRYAAAAFCAALQSAGVGGADGPSPRPAPQGLAALPGGARMVAKTPASVAGGPAEYGTAADRVLNSPSSRVSLALYENLGENAQKEIVSLLGAHATVVDPSGLGLENYLTAHSVAALLARAWKDPSLHAFARVLPVGRLWVSRTPEQETLAGYVRTAGGRVYAVAVIVGGLPWSGRFEPSAGWAAYPSVP